MLLPQPMHLWALYTSTLIVLLQNDHNDTTIEDGGNFTYISDRKLTQGAVASPHRQLANYWLAKNCLEEESPIKSCRFCPFGKCILSQQKNFNLPVQFWTTTERVWLMFWPDDWSFYLYLFACSDIMAPETTWHDECQRGDYVACIFIWEPYMFVTSEKLD